jgi:NAD-dependent dihydropyrimidine dehydrogenase PreA subunit
MVKIVVDSTKCIGCGSCVKICPAGVYELRNGKSTPARAEECLFCHACQAKFP